MRRLKFYNMCNTQVQIIVEGSQKFSLPGFSDNLLLEKFEIDVGSSVRIEWVVEGQILETNLEPDVDCRIHLYPLGLITITQENVVQSIRGELLN